MNSSDHAVVITRIADALERIATALESAAKPKEATWSGKRGTMPAVKGEWIVLVKRVLRGEKVAHIAKDIGASPTRIRTQVLKAFERRNPAKYAELREKRDYGCMDHPSMRLLILHRGEFGF